MRTLARFCVYPLSLPSRGNVSRGGHVCRPARQHCGDIASEMLQRADLQEMVGDLLAKLFDFTPSAARRQSGVATVRGGSFNVPI
jgi:hypothetical protein